MKTRVASLLFLCCTIFIGFTQNTEENRAKFQQEHEELQNEVQQKLAQLEVEYEKELGQIAQNYKAEMTKLQAEYVEKNLNDAATLEKYKIDAGKINSKYDLKAKDLIYIYTVDKAKIENDYYHERNKLMHKYDVYPSE